ncbi:type IX secretion system plug protein domain-containing protein [Cytophaga aurantiaca]|uniref:type IX secretion system plug protein n=1 Tax=Cytophaga aurantiaca TaxID=29530 RepID=UPI00035E0769|nr:type IX secretion system plug protein domain-containing protein [Cytophaga aurantiaca]
MRNLFFVFFLLLAASFRVFAADVKPEDNVFSDKIKSVLFYAEPDGSKGVPIVPFNQNTRLILEFDELNAEQQYFYYKIYHYNADWTQSYLSQSQYLYDFNEFRVPEADMSFKTRIAYNHYTVVIPKVKVSGNFLIKIYRNYDEDDVIITRQFVIYENVAPVTALVTRSINPADAFTKQQVNFQINYGNLDITNPYNDVKVRLRQNYKNYNAITNLRPVFIKDYEKSLDYQFYNGENTFNGGNEFRYFDLRSVLFNGIYIGRVERTNERCDAWILPEMSRKKLAYAFYDDINGAFFPQLYENLNTTTDPDYVMVHFQLTSTTPAPGDVYITGRFTNWKTLPEYKLTYNADEKYYSGAFWLKQGYYNYSYSVVDAAGVRDDIYFEGNSSLTENAYDIIVYARLQGDMYDRAIGYYSQRYRGR